MVDDWEASQPEYQRTAVVLEHFDREINDVHGGVEDEDGAHPLSSSPLPPKPKRLTRMNISFLI